MRLPKILGLLALFSFILFLLPSIVYALANPDDAVGPELAFFDKSGQEGVNQKVLVPNRFGGAVQVINEISADPPFNPAPGTSVTLRLASIFYSTTPEQMAAFAQKLNNFGGFPAGTVVIVGNELNNLTSREYSMPNATPNNAADLRTAAAKYAEQYNAFARAIDHSKYKVAPAPPDLYNGDWDPVPWVQEFRRRIDCGATDALIANVFDVPPRVPGAWNETYKYLEANICPQKGLRVTRFGGWGTQPDKSVKEQVEWYNTTPLPSGVSQATTLIPDNCDGRRGNEEKRWLYYIKGEVFKADGTKLNPETCTSSGLGAGEDPRDPKPVPYVPCNDDRPTYFGPFSKAQFGSEYHSLRPYQASPCDRQIVDTALYCGNDIVVKKTFRVLPTDPGVKSCSPLPDGGQRCEYEYDASVNANRLQITLENAELPIMGNTQNVPNQYNNGTPRSPVVSPPTRLNEYVSWYLNGVNQRAEEPAPVTDIYKLINWSGPLKKLLPERIQRVQRLITIAKGSKHLDLSGDQRSNLGKVENAVKSIPPEGYSDFEKNHNQIVGCIKYDGTLAGSTFPCSAQGILKGGFASFVTNTPAMVPIRLADFLKNASTGYPNTPPLEEDYKNADGSLNFTEYWTQYKNWLGRENCLTLPVIGGRVCISALGLRQTYWPALFSMIPFSGTEDRLGQIHTPDGRPLLEHPSQSEQPKSEVEVSEISYVPDKRTHKLYFSHMKEDSDLSDLIQGTYLPRGVPAYTVTVDHRDAYTTERCEILDARTNPGDSLFGDYNQPPESPISDVDGDRIISGQLAYKAKFTCDFPPEVNASCVERCVAEGQTIDVCSTQICKSAVPECKRVSLVAVSVYTKTPRVDKIWDQLVNGSMSVFKRIYPKVGPNSPVTEIKDVPAVTKASYGGASSSENSSTQVLAGDPGKERDGSNAQIFFPHIGGIYDYFLKGIQKAIRPKGIGTLSDIVEPPPVGDRACKVANPTRENTEDVAGRNYVITDNVIGLAVEVSKMMCAPAELLIGVLAQETGGKNFISPTPNPPVYGVNDIPIKGDANEKVCRTLNCLKEPPTGILGAYSWTGTDFRGQVGRYQARAEECVSKLGAGSLSSPDARILGQAMCVTAAKFWDSIRDGDPNAPECTGANKKSYTLGEVNSLGIRYALLHFCGAGVSVCSSFIDRYNEVISAYSDDVNRVRDELKACLTTTN